MRPTFSREFKLEAVRLVTERGVAVAQARRDLDVAESVLRRWMRELAQAPSGAFLPQVGLRAAGPTLRRLCVSAVGHSRPGLLESDAEGGPMSRSRRRTPVTGITTAESDKAFKVAEHRRARRGLHAVDLAEDEPPHARIFGNPWASEKDGKTRFDPGAFPELMRK